MTDPHAPRAGEEPAAPPRVRRQSSETLEPSETGEPRDSGETGEPSETPEPSETGAPRPSTVRDVEYKGAPLDAARGPGLGCFWIQLALLVVLVVLTPLSVVWDWPELVSAGLMLATLVLLLFAGQTVIFLLRLVAADRRAELRRAPMASRTKTVGQLEDEALGEPPDTPGGPGRPSGGVPE